MKTKIESKLIEAFPICDEGKTALRELLGSMGFEIEATVGVLERKPGQIFLSTGGDYAVLSPEGYVWLNGDGLSMHKSNSFEYKAASIDEFITLKSRGEL